MLKKRIIPIQLLIDGRLVKTVHFGEYRDVGDPVASSRVYNDQYADELAFLNIGRDERSISPMMELLEQVSEVCFMPLSLGGGIQRSRDAAQLIQHGADKVVVNSAVFRDYDMVRQIADEFGSQSVIVSIDVRYDATTGQYVNYSDCGRVRESISLEDHIDRAVDHGAGEILINSIDRDGTMSGYDVSLLRLAARRSPVPVIGCGGAGHYDHMKEAFLETGVNALACGSLFNFGDNNPIRAKAFLSNYGLSFKVI